MKTKTKTKVSLLKSLKWKRVALVTATATAVIIGSFGAYFAWNIYKQTDEFDAKNLLADEPSRIYDANGELIFTLGSDENGKRMNVEYEDLPQVLIDAIIAAEDSRFFIHDGFDLPRIGKAFITNLSAGRITAGGSTITQQVIKKSYFPEEQQTYTRKFSEIFLAMQATKEVNKEEILTMYLNKIYFGRSLSSIGVGAASQYYFDKEVSQLTLPEAALLAGTLNSPSRYDPYHNLELATQRRNIILGLMVDHGYISEEEATDARNVPIENMLSQNATTLAHQAYIDAVIKEVKDRTGLDPVDVQMEIHTFLNPDIQEYVDDLANEGFAFPDEYMQVGASIQSNKDGRIISVIGGRNYQNFGMNRSTIKQQPGSSLKPVIAYGAAFEYLNWSTGHEVEDKAFTKVPGYNPTNYDGTVGQHGKMSIAQALYNSWNLPAIWTLDAVTEEVGGAAIYSMFERFGVDMTGEDRTIPPSFAIGGWSNGTTPMELASIQSTIANNGTHVEAHTINYIEIVNDGTTINVDEDIQAAATQAISAESAFMIREVQAEQMAIPGSGYRALQFGEIRAKTGTTNHPRDGMFQGAAKDSWLAAYNPDYAIAVWMGYDEADAREHGLTMSNNQLIARQFSARIYEKLTENGVQNSYSSAPSGVYQAPMVIGSYPYRSPSANTPEQSIRNAWFKNGHGPQGQVEDLGINNLSSFDAHINSDGSIGVNFAPYDPADAVTNRETNEATKLYGRVRYGVDIKDAVTGQLLQSYQLESPSGTLDYTPSSSVIVSGYYTYENASSIRSNEISINLNGDDTDNNIELGPIQYTITDSNGNAISGRISKGSQEQIPIFVSVTRQRPGSKITIALLSESGSPIGETTDLPENSTSANVTLRTTGRYIIQITETYNGVSAPPATITIDVVE